MRAQDPGETKGAADINVDVGGGLGEPEQYTRAAEHLPKHWRWQRERSSRHGKRRTREVVDREGLDKGKGRERAWGDAEMEASDPEICRSGWTWARSDGNGDDSV